MIFNFNYKTSNFNLYNQILKFNYPDIFNKINKKDIAQIMDYYCISGDRDFSGYIRILEESDFNNFSLTDKNFMFQIYTETIFYKILDYMYLEVPKTYWNNNIWDIAPKIHNILEYNLISSQSYDEIIKMVNIETDKLYQENIEKLKKQDIITEKQYELSKKFSSKNIINNNFLKLEIGTNITELNNINKTNLTRRIYELKKQLLTTYLYANIGVRIITNENIDKDEIKIFIEDKQVAQCKIYTNRALILDSNDYNSLSDIQKINAIKEQDIITQRDCYWVESDNFKFLNPQYAIKRILKDILFKNVDKLIDTTNLAKHIKFNINNDIKNVLINLIKEQVRLKEYNELNNTSDTFKKISNYLKKYKNADIVSEKLRMDFAEYICTDIAKDNNILYTITLSTDIENIIRNNINNINIEDFVKKIVQNKNTIYQRISQEPILLCSKDIRLQVFKLLDKNNININVIAKEEVIPKFEIKKLGIIE